MDKRGFEFSFAWIFAVIVGAFVIFLAIYTVVRIASMEKNRIDTTRGKEIGILLTPIETNLEDSKLDSILIPNGQETTLFSGCVPPTSSGGENPFGTQKINTSVRTGIGKQDIGVQGVQSSFHNKYLFARNSITAEKEFFVLSKPFMFPFKVADIIIMWSDSESYCFVNTFPELKDELKNLKIEEKNIALVSDINNCNSGSRKVCFGSTDYGGKCDIIVFETQSIVEYKTGGKVDIPVSTDINNKYPLLLAAIFSEPSKFDCESARIGARATALAKLYKLKSNYLTSTSNCNSAPLLPYSLESYITSAENIENSADLAQLKDKAEDLKSKNAPLNCKLF